MFIWDNTTIQETRVYNVCRLLVHLLAMSRGLISGLRQ